MKTSLAGVQMVAYCLPKMSIADFFRRAARKFFVDEKIWFFFGPQNTSILIKYTFSARSSHSPENGTRNNSVTPPLSPMPKSPSSYTITRMVFRVESKICSKIETFWKSQGFMPYDGLSQRAPRLVRARPPHGSDLVVNRRTDALFVHCTSWVKRRKRGSGLPTASLGHLSTPSQACSAPMLCSAGSSMKARGHFARLLRF